MIKVLFADDESDILDQAKIFLEKEDESISVEAVSSAEKGLELLRKEDFDCIVSDYQMPEMDGLDFLETVRKDLDSDIPFIVFTGKGREEVAIKALNLGADRYLQKGGNPKSQYGVLADTIIQSVSHWRSRKRLRESEREKSLILDSASEIIAFHNKDHELVWANRAYAEATGKNLEELEGQKCYQAWLGNEEPCEECPVTEAIEVGEVRERVMSPVSEEDYWRLRGSPVRNDSGEIIGALETGVKITEKIEQEEELRERTEMLEGMLDGIQDVVGFQKPDHTVIRYNQAGYDLLGMSPDEVKGKKCYELIGRDEECEKCATRKALKSKNIETVEKYQPELGRYLKATSTPVLDEEGEVSFIIEQLRDITERKETEQNLERSKKRFDTLLSNTPAVIYTYEVVDGTPETTFVSESVKDVLGHEPEYYTSDPENFLNDLHPEDSQELFEKEEKLLTDEETDRITAEYRFKDKQGNYRWLHDEEQLITYDDGTREVIGAWWDITERKGAEEKEEFLHSLLRHDVRNKAQIVQGYHGLLRDYDLPEEAEDYVEKSRKAVKDSIDLIEKVRTLREIREEEELEEVSIGSVIDKVVVESDSQADEKGIELESGGLDCKVQGGPLLEELFSNLLENSIKHADCGKIRIWGEETAGKCVVTVEDDGKGISEDKKDKIFEKGYKAGETGESGLGLYLVKKIAEGYGGSVEVKDSELGGARFDVVLQKV